jgi:hypothetical protein
MISRMSQYCSQTGPSSRRPRRTWALRPAAALTMFHAASMVLWGQSTLEYELPPILYSTTEATNAVTELDQQLKSGSWQPSGYGEVDLLRGTLSVLEVPIDSQVLVFSKTSLQRKLIHPRNPRALYFSDDCYVGWVPGGLMEIAVTDARLGVAFYRMDRHAAGGSVQFKRDPDCLNCHAGPLTGQWPGLMIRSVFADERGEPYIAAGSFLTTHESPFAQRWGGWYVTGSHGTARHMGNTIAHKRAGAVELDLEAGANQITLAPFLSTDRYLRPDSDIVALMVLEHQVEMHNRLIRGALRVRRWLHYQENLRKELGQPASAEPTGSARVVVDSETSRILEYLLFCDELPLADVGVRGNHQFPAAFARNRRADSLGRSLKDLDLRTRLFAVRCSYMIYSQSFDHLPVPLKLSIYHRLREVLEAEPPPPRFAHLSGAERHAIREILTATKPDLAEAWSVEELEDHEASNP